MRALFRDVNHAIVDFRSARDSYSRSLLAIERALIRTGLELNVARIRRKRNNEISRRRRSNRSITFNRLPPWAIVSP